VAQIKKWFFPCKQAVQEGKTIMFSSEIHEQTIIEISQGDYIAITAESFLVDRQSAGRSQHTLKFYRQFLNPFIRYMATQLP
jgi:hypothetical protein